MQPTTHRHQLHQVTTETPCTWSAIMRHMSVIGVQEGYRPRQGTNQWAYAFTLGRLTQKQLEWVMHFPNTEVTECPVEGIVRPDGTPIKRIFTVYLFPNYGQETQDNKSKAQQRRN